MQVGRRVELCLSAFRLSLIQNAPAECVRRTLNITRRASGEIILNVGNTEYNVCQKNLHIVAVGKAACNMVLGAESVLRSYIADGIASVPKGSIVPTGVKTQFLTGAVDNLPDEDALKNTELIREYLKNVSAELDQILLFLISGGGSALLCSPIDGITLSEKLTVIRTLAHNGADIQQLNIVRSALSRVKGGGLAALGPPSRMIGLIISDVIGDPLDIISSGPTVPPGLLADARKTPLEVLKELDVDDKIPTRIVDILKLKNGKVSRENDSKLDVNNVIVCNNRLLLNTLADNFVCHKIRPYLVTTVLHGNASLLGQLLMELVNIIVNFRTNYNTEKPFEEVTKKFVDLNLEDFSAERFLREMERLVLTQQRFVLLFGGESTVNFPPEAIRSGGKGGRNQELVLAALKFGAENHLKITPSNCAFALFSLGTDGQDGPTDATGAYLTSENFAEFQPNDFQVLSDCLDGKNSYAFWSTWNGGRNLVKLNKTGTNLMDVQILYFEFD